jgi:hypothetical protein
MNANVGISFRTCVAQDRYRCKCPKYEHARLVKHGCKGDEGQYPVSFHCISLYRSLFSTFV